MMLSFFLLNFFSVENAMKDSWVECAVGLQKDCRLLQSQLETDERSCWGPEGSEHNLKQSGGQGMVWSRGDFNRTTRSWPKFYKITQEKDPWGEVRRPPNSGSTWHSQHSWSEIQNEFHEWEYSHSYGENDRWNNSCTSNNGKYI